MSGICVWLGCRHRGAQGTLGRQKEGFPPQNAPSWPPPAGSPRALAGCVVIGCCGSGWRWGPVSPSPAPQLHPLHPGHRLCPLGSCRPEALQGLMVTTVRMRPRAARNDLAGCEEEEEGETEDGQSPNHSPGRAQGTGQPPAGAESSRGAAANLLPARPDPAPCTQRRAQVPLAVPNPQCPPTGW